MRSSEKNPPAARADSLATSYPVLKLLNGQYSIFTLLPADLRTVGIIEGNKLPSYHALSVSPLSVFRDLAGPIYGMQHANSIADVSTFDACRFAGRMTS